MKVSFILIWAFAAQVYAHSGGYSGGGGDHQDIGTGTAWYIGNKKISYCIEKSANFGVGTVDLQQTFEKAAATWRQYILQRHIQMDLPPEHRLNLNFQYQGACQGSENLRLYFGVDSPEVVEAKKKYQKPYALSYRESYDVATGMGKGFIWLAQTGSLFPLAGDTGFPNWTKPFTVHGMMLHELGHVLGVGHLDGTIMREEMMATMQLMDSSEEWSLKRGEAKLTNIDDIKILFLRNYFDLVIPGRLTYRQDPLETAAIFHLFMGRNPVGEVQTSFINGTPFKWILGDDRGQVTFDISSSVKLQRQFNLLQRIFGAHYMDKYSTTLSSSAIGVSGVGVVTAKTGKSYTLHYSINAEGLDGPVRVTLMDGLQSKEVFFSNINGSLP